MFLNNAAQRDIMSIYTLKKVLSFAAFFKMHLKIQFLYIHEAELIVFQCNEDIRIFCDGTCQDHF